MRNLAAESEYTHDWAQNRRRTAAVGSFSLGCGIFPSTENQVLLSIHEIVVTMCSLNLGEMAALSIYLIESHEGDCCL